jgi:hypothetical protein
MLTVLIAFAARPTAAPTPRNIVLYTPELAAALGNNLGCEVVNVATTSRSISMDLVLNDGTSQHMPAAGGSLIVPPGDSFRGGVVSPYPGFIGYCKITVEAGTSSLDVRGAVVVSDGATAQTIAVASAY